MKVKIELEVELDGEGYRGRYGVPEAALPGEVADHISEALSVCQGAAFWSVTRCDAVEPTRARRFADVPARRES